MPLWKEIPMHKTFAATTALTLILATTAGQEDLKAAEGATCVVCGIHGVSPSPIVRSNWHTVTPAAAKELLGCPCVKR